MNEIDRTAELERCEERHEAERRFSPPRGYCPYCSQDMSIKGNGWTRMYDDDDTPLAILLLVSHYFADWGGWFKPCWYCNPKAELPEGVA
jgi:hypothetical protein